MKKVELEDGLYQFHVSYIVYEPLENIFTSSTSNFDYAVVQARKNYKKILGVEGGREAIHEMMTRGKKEGHFHFLNEQETRDILNGPHYFCSSTVSWKDTEKRKVRHVSNPSSVSKASSRSLKMMQ